jgi:putative tricarboxylic transport membrane protein
MQATRFIAALMYAPRAYLLPLILMFCILGAFALNNRMFDVGVVLAFGVVGFVMERSGIPLGPFVIGVVLAPIAEFHLRSGLMGSAGSWMPLLTRPLACAFLVISILLVLWPIVTDLRSRWRPRSRAGDA